MAGLLTKPDQWSFTMPGKIWVDQSWLTHLIYYLSYSMMDDLGPVLLKALLLTLCLIVLYLQCRGRGAGMEATVAALIIGYVGLGSFPPDSCGEFRASLFPALCRFFERTSFMGQVAASGLSSHFGGVVQFARILFARPGAPGASIPGGAFVQQQIVG